MKKPVTSTCFYALQLKHNYTIKMSKDQFKKNKITERYHWLSWQDSSFKQCGYTKNITTQFFIAGKYKREADQDTY